MKENLVRHQVIQDVPMYMTANNFHTGHVISFDELAKLRGNYNERIKAIKYLLSTGHLEYGEGDDIPYVRVSKKGLDAANGEFFLSNYKEERGKRRNNRWMIATNVIVAGGVIYSIFQDTIKRKSPEQRIEQTETLQTKIVIPLLDSTKTIPSRQATSDSTNP